MKLLNRKINKMKSKEKKERIIQSLLFYASENSIGTKELNGVQWDIEKAPKSA